MKNKIKKLVFTADDFGMSQAFNEAVLTGFNEGFLTSTCICANGAVFENAVKEILPQCPGIGLGVHLNIVEGKSTRKNISRTSLLCDSAGFYKKGFLNFLVNSKNRQLLQEIEADYRNQLEFVFEYAEIDHLNSHVHTHGIPAIFDIVCKLAKEYNISFVRTQYEKFYMIPDFLKHLNYKYPANLPKITILNILTRFNFEIARQYSVKTNKYLIGTGYTGFMDSKTIEYGLKAIKDENCITEILIHPCKFDYNYNQRNPRYIEFQITQNKELFDKIKSMGWDLTNYRFICN